MSQNDTFEGFVTIQFVVESPKWRQKLSKYQTQIHIDSASIHYSYVIMDAMAS